MNFQTLYYFSVVAEELNISHAADKLYISQQSLSSQISRMESELKVRLFERSPRLSLTYAGICTLRTARQILDLEKQMYQQLDDIADQKIGSLTIGATHVRARTILPEILPQYIKEYPKVELHTVIGSMADIWDKLLSGKLNLIISNRPEEHPLVESVPLMQDNFCVVIPRKLMEQNLIHNYKLVVNSWLESRNLDLNLMENVPVLLSQGTTIRRKTDLYFAKYHITPNILFEANDMETIFALCTKGMGITFSYEKYANTVLCNRENSDKEVFIFPLKDENLSGQIKLSYLKDRYQSKIVRAFIKIAQESLCDQNLQPTVSL